MHRKSQKNKMRRKVVVSKAKFNEMFWWFLGVDIVTLQAIRKERKKCKKIKKSHATATPTRNQLTYLASLMKSPTRTKNFFFFVFVVFIFSVLFRINYIPVCGREQSWCSPALLSLHITSHWKQMKITYFSVLTNITKYFFNFDHFSPNETKSGKSIKCHPLVIVIAWHIIQHIDWILVFCIR